MIDNHSQDGSPKAIAEQFPEVEQIINSHNLGSTGGYNTGFRHALKAGAEFILLLNNDTWIDPDALNHLLEACLPEDVGVTGPLIYYASQPDKIWSAGAMRSSLTLDLMGNHGRNESFEEVTERES